ncbi:MAG: diacylglycerol/lipid kinase family protein [Acidimicrobiia bacterium]
MTIGYDAGVRVDRIIRRSALRGVVAAAATAPLAGPVGAASAFTVGSAMESSRAGLLAAPTIAAALLVDRAARPTGWKRWVLGRTGHSPRTAALAMAAGAGMAALTTRLWPVAPDEPAATARRRPKVDERPSADGKGLHIVVNPGSGPALAASPVDVLREGLPGATITELAEGDNPVDALEAAADGASILGVAGGDGTVNAAAGVALAAGLPLLVVPAGTLNHFARALGIDTVAEAVEAVKAGHLAEVDVAEIDEKPFLNTASFGVYVDLVDARERLENRIGKWPAMVIALFGVLRRGEPVDLVLDGERRRLWLAFLGNCRYDPPGFAPSWRARLDDGRIDVRLVDGDAPFARARLFLAVLTGTLARSNVYEARDVERLTLRSLDGPLRLARDGETFDGTTEAVISKCPSRLRVFVPSGP